MRIAAPNGDVDTINAKEWIAKNPPGYAQNFQRDFTTRYYNGPEAYQKMRDLAAEFANISEAVKLPEKSTGYQRKAQTMLGYQQASYVTFDANNLPVGFASHERQRAPRGQRRARDRPHLEGVGPSRRQQPHRPAGEPAGANSSPLAVSVTGNHIAVSLATGATARSPARPRRSSPRSTPTRRRRRW